ncbi:MAG: hypothetical protein AMXMBFR64_39930 [Myxococcales bacterium]
MISLAFFNNKGGVGKTTLVYHIASMLGDLGHRVLMVDLDPQSNLTAMCLDEDRLEELWPLDGEHTETLLGCLRPILRGTGDIGAPHVESVDDRLGLLVGDLALSAFEDKLSETWPKVLDRDEAAFRVQSAFHRAISAAAKEHEAEVVLIDVGPNLGAINRSALLAADHVLTPLSPDLFSMQGLRNLGPTLRSWRAAWDDRLARRPMDLDAGLELPAGRMNPLGYLVMQTGMRLDRPVRAYDRWVGRAPEIYHRFVLDDSSAAGLGFQEDPSCLGVLRHYQSLMPLAQDARKPMFRLTPADGAMGAHVKAVGRCRDDFARLCHDILRRVGIEE